MVRGAWRWEPVSAYTRWLHTRWPAGAAEVLPEVREDFSTAVPGLYVVGDLAGVPLFKFSADSGARAVRTILADPRFQARPAPDAMDSMAGVEPPWDLVIVGAGVAGMSAALEAERAGLRFLVVESAQPFSTVHNFLRGKPIYTYPTGMVPAGDLRIEGATREAVLEAFEAQTLGRGIEPVVGEATGVRRRQGLLEVELAAEAVVEPGDGLIAAEETRHRSRGRHAPRPLLAHRVIVAIGRSGAHRMLNVAGEELPKVYNRLHDPADFRGQRVVVVGGGDSAVETAVALATSGAVVTLSYRGKELTRPKPGNMERLREAMADGGGRMAAGGKAGEIEAPADVHETTATGEEAEGRWEDRGDRSAPRYPTSAIALRLGTTVERIDADAVVLRHRDHRIETVGNDAVFTMIGRDAPLDFFRRSRVPIVNERNVRWWVTLLIAVAVFTAVYHWKKTGVRGFQDIPVVREVVTLGDTWARNGWWPYNVPGWLAGASEVFADPGNPLGTLRVSLGEPGFWYSLAYCAAVVGFGIKRIRKRRVPYVKWQTWTLALIQVIPLFLLPYLVLPWMGHNGLFDGGVGKWFADEFFPAVTYTEHGREYWRAFGLILAWPLFIWNVFTSQPMWGWLVLSFVQTFVIIPVIVYIWGKGAYCGWICSCGALAETMGDAHREKMPHGPGWNRLNMLGQVFLVFALAILALRIIGWIWPGSWAGQGFGYLLYRMPVLNYAWFVDLLWAGILGVGLYWHFSGRVWCRFACPLAALMHVYHRFGRFRILAVKERCISCNVCTSVCHQGIDVMSFANKGEPMADPQCVRCSACVQMCPTGVLSFGQVNPRTGEVIREDPAWLAASPVRMVEMRVNGKRVL